MLSCKKIVGKLVLVGLVIGILGVVFLIVGGVLKSEPSSETLIMVGAICFGVGFVGSCVSLERYVYHFIIRKETNYSISVPDIPVVAVEYV